MRETKADDVVRAFLETGTSSAKVDWTLLSDSFDNAVAKCRRSCRKAGGVTCVASRRAGGNIWLSRSL